MSNPDTRTIGFIGSGHIGSTLARLAVDAGIDVVMSNSRGPETLAELVDQLGPRASAGTAEEAATAGDVVVVTVPLTALGTLPVDALSGKVVLDTGNYYPQRDGQIAELDDESTTTSELLQRELGDARVVKAFNNINFSHLAALGRPRDSTERSVIAIAGDDEDAKQVATELIDRLGYDTYDAGALAEGWRFQRDTAAYGKPYVENGSWEQPHPATAARMSTLLSEAVRYRDM